jgi:hypothetical protein
MTAFDRHILLIAGFGILGAVVFWGVSAYVVIHFVRKFW